MQVLIAPEGVVPVLQFLKDHHNAQFVNVADITALDVPSRHYRFEVGKLTAYITRFARFAFTA